VAVADVNEGGLAETVAASSGARGKIHARRLPVSNEGDIAS
jgi:hypothetical protein